MAYTIRICKATGEPELFFYDGSELTVYSHVGQHAAASVDYLRGSTRPARTAAEIQACTDLARGWLALPAADGTKWVQVSRLARGGAL